MKDCKEIYLSCNDRAEVVQFLKYEWEDGSVDYEICVMDSYCGEGTRGIAKRFKRAWKAFWGKPICYTGVCCDDEERMRKFLTDCLSTMVLKYYGGQRT